MPMNGFSARIQRQKRSATPKGMGYCSKCDTYKPAADFRKNAAHKTKRKQDPSSGLTHYCKDCYKIMERKASAAAVAKNRQQNYGITEEEYQALKEQQGGVCAICGQPQKVIMKGKPIDLCVDHDHETGKVRGLLCVDCNHGLGRFKDSIDNLSAAIDYLMGLNR